MSETQPKGYMATPANSNGRAVLVLHAWWGLNDTIKSICDRLAKEGYLAFALDLYNGQTGTTIEEAKKVLTGYFSKKNVKIGEIKEQELFFEAEIRDGKNNLIDKVIVDKRTGRIRSTY